MVAVILFIFVLFLYKFLTQKEVDSDNSPIASRLKYSITLFKFLKLDVLVSLVYFAAIVFVIIIPQDNSLWIDWSKISFLNWLRLIASFLLTSFLPGYVILKAIDFKLAIKGTARIVFSFLLSLLVTTVFGITLEFSGYRIGEYGFTAFMSINIFFFLMLLCLNLRNLKNLGYIKQSNETKSPILLLIALVILQSALLFVVFFSQDSFLKGDMWDHFGDASNLLKYGLNIQTELTSYNGYFLGYRIFNAVFLLLGGFPLINAEITMVFLYPISLIAFYSMVSLFFKDRLHKVPILATTIWTLFSGFDWVYLVLYGIVPAGFSPYIVFPIASKTMSGVIYPYGTFGYDHPLFIISITAVFMLMFLFKSSKLNISSIFLIFAVTFVGFIVHPPEIMIFMALLIPCLLVFYRNELLPEFRKGLVSMIVALILILVLDFLSPEGPLYTNLYGLPITIEVACVGFFLTFILRKVTGIKNRITTIILSKKIKELIVIAIFIVSYLFFFSFILISTSSLSSPGFSGGALIHVTPWFAYSLRLGVAGILLIASGIYLAIKREFPKVIVFFISLTIFSVILDEVYVNFYSPAIVFSNNDRILYLLFVPVSIVSAWILHKFFSRTVSLNSSSSLFRKMNGNFLASLFLVVIIIGGSLSTIISSEYWSFTSGPYGFPQDSMPKDTAALSYLQADSSAFSTVITNLNIQAQVVTLANMQSLDNNQFDSWFGTTQPELLFTFKKLWNVHYAYLNSSDIKTISNAYPNGYFLNHLLNYLPKSTFAGSDISVYRFPQLFPPAGNNLSIVIPSASDDKLLFSIETFASSGLEYNLRKQEDSFKFNASTIVLPFDPTLSSSTDSVTNTQSLSESQIRGYTDWLNRGGHLVVFDNSGNGYFASMFGLRTTGTAAANGIANQESAISLENINVTKVEFTDLRSIVVANYTLNEQPVSPFAVTKAFGEGQVTYVMTKSFYDSMIDTMNETVKVSLFSKINLTSFFVSTLPLYPQPTDYQRLWPSTMGSSAAKVAFSGNIQLNADSFIFEETDIDTLDFKSAESVLIEYNDSNDTNTLEQINYELTNSTLLELNVEGSPTLNITTEEAQIEENQFFPEGLSDLSSVRFGNGFRVQITLDNNSSIRMSVSRNNTVFSIVAKGGTITLNTSHKNSSILLRSPKINVTGNSFFERASFHKKTRDIGYFSPIEINGAASFEVSLSDNNKIYFSNTNLEGELNSFDADPTGLLNIFFSYESWGINWSEAFFSPWNILLIALLLVIYVKFVLRKSK